MDSADCDSIIAVGIMRDNINRVAERGERLDTLQDKVRDKMLKSERLLTESGLDRLDESHAPIINTDCQIIWLYQHKVSGEVQIGCASKCGGR